MYDGVESPRSSAEGYRISWYRSSQKREEDAAQRRRGWNGHGPGWKGCRRPAGGPFRGYGQVTGTGQEVLQREVRSGGSRLRVAADVEEEFHQVGPGRRGSAEVRPVETWTYRSNFDEDGAAGAFP